MNKIVINILLLLAVLISLVVTMWAVLVEDILTSIVAFVVLTYFAVKAALRSSIYSIIYTIRKCTLIIIQIQDVPDCINSLKSLNRLKSFQAVAQQLNCKALIHGIQGQKIHQKFDNSQKVKESQQQKRKYLH